MKEWLLVDMQKKEWWTQVLCACWWIWWQRNEFVFQGKRLRSDVLEEKKLQEGTLWFKFCSNSPNLRSLVVFITDAKLQI